MKILILGTSNSLLRTGWVDGLRVGIPEAEIHNLSIGASPGIQFSSKLDIDFSYYDFVFFDSIPNDEEYYSWNLSKQNKEDIDFFFNIIENIIDHINGETKLILLFIKTKNNFFEQSPIYDHRINYAQRKNIPYIDSFSIISFLIKNWKIKFSDIYKYHPAHPEVSMLNLIGRKTGLLLPSRVENKILHNNFRRNAFKKNHPKEFSEKIRYHNSIIDEDFYIVSSGTKIFLDETKVYVGMYINIRNTNALLRFFDFQNNEIYNISLYYSYDNNKSSIVKVFIPCPKKIHPAYILVDTPKEETSPYIGMGSSEEIIDASHNQICFSEIITSEINFVETADRNSKQDDITEEIISLIKKEQNFSFFITPRHECNSLQKTICYLEEQVKSQKKQLSIMSHSENLLAFDINNQTFVHKKIWEISNDNFLKLIQVEFKNNKTLSMFFEFAGSRFLVSPYKEEVLDFEFSGIHITFSQNGLYLCAHPDGSITADREKASDWEKFILTYLM